MATVVEYLQLHPVLLCIGLVVLYLASVRYAGPFRVVPGPFLASISGMWMAKEVSQGTLPWDMIDLHKQHGPLVRIAPNEVSVSDAAAVRTIYGPGNKFWKTDFYMPQQGKRKFDIFAERNEQLHGQQRRLVSSAYSMTSLVELEVFVDNTIKVFHEEMAKRCGQSLDFANWLQLFAFDVIGEVSFSRSFGFLQAGKDDGSFGLIERATRSGAFWGEIPTLYALAERLGINKYMAISQRNSGIREFASKCVEARRRTPSDRRDLLARLFTIHNEKPDVFEDADVTSMSTSNIFAGSDTTAISLRAIIYYLLKSPSCKKRLVDEIDANLGLGECISFSDSNKLPYLQAVIKEGLRLHPAVGQTLPRYVPEGGADIAGVHFPAGAKVGVNPWVIHRNTDIFGPDADAYRPERWLEGSEAVAHLERNMFTFGAGSRVCLGKSISLLEIGKLVPYLLRNFEIELTDPKGTWTASNGWFVFQKDMLCTLSLRT